MKLKKSNLLEVFVWLLVYCALQLLGYFISRRTFIWLSLLMILGIVIAYFTVRRIDKNGLLCIPILWLIGPSSIHFWYLTLDYTYVNGDGFFYESIIIGAIIGVLLTVIFFWKGKKISERIGIMVLWAILCSVSLFALFTNLNYILDFSEPQCYSAVIEGKDVDYNRKSPNSYGFKVTADGKSFYLDVSRSEYRKYDVGDTYRFKKYNGTFGKPFFVPWYFD